jgi:hypothetical protein
MRNESAGTRATAQIAPLMLPQLKQQDPKIAELDRRRWTAGLCFTSYGLCIGIRTNRRDVLERMLPFVPPGWKPARSPQVDHLYSVQVGGKRDDHMLYAGPLLLARSRELAELFPTLENHLALTVGSLGAHVFVHAGVVGWRGRAILFPGRSYSGKTTLVAALVRAGAAYYSDEYAVLDEQGRVHPYPRWLGMRGPDGVAGQRCPPEDLGGPVGTEPLPVGLVIVTRYQQGASWRPRRLGAGRAALALLDNALSARDQPAKVLTVLQQVVSRAVALKGIRGEAEEAATALLSSKEETGRSPCLPE